MQLKPDFFPQTLKTELAQYLLISKLDLINSVLSICTLNRVIKKLAR